MKEISRREFLRYGLGGLGTAVLGTAGCRRAEITPEMQARIPEVEKMREMLKGHKVTATLQGTIDSFLFSLIGASQSAYNKVVERNVKGLLEKTEYVINYGKRNGTVIETIILTSTPRTNDSTNEQLVLILDNPPPPNMNYQAIQVRFRQHLVDLFADMQQPHAFEHMGTLPDSPRVDIYTHQGDKETIGSFSMSASIRGTKEELQHNYIKAK